MVLNASVALYTRPLTHKYHCVINVLLINCGEMRARSSDEQKSHSLTGTLVEQKHEVRLNWTGLRNLLVGGPYLILRTRNTTTWASFQLAQVYNVPNDWAARCAVPYCTVKVVKNVLRICSEGYHTDSEIQKVSTNLLISNANVIILIILVSDVLGDRDRLLEYFMDCMRGANH